MMGIPTLVERLDDPEETFTCEEVHTLIDYYEQRALNDIYNQSRIAENIRASRERSAALEQQKAELLATLSDIKAPTLQVIRYE